MGSGSRYLGAAPTLPGSINSSSAPVVIDFNSSDCVGVGSAVAVETSVKHNPPPGDHFYTITYSITTEAELKLTLPRDIGRGRYALGLFSAPNTSVLVHTRLGWWRKGTLPSISVGSN